jgi:hypothetical protein
MSENDNNSIILLTVSNTETPNNSQIFTNDLFDDLLFHQGRSIILPFVHSEYIMNEFFGEMMNYSNPLVRYNDDNEMMRIGLNESLNSYKTRERKPNIKLLINSQKVNVNNKDDMCAICKSEFILDENITPLPCNHILHTECITEWVKYKSDCPVCRGVIPTIDTYEDDILALEDNEDIYNDECDECKSYESYESSDDL